jgi:2-dehydro-3-deoxyglucarate aldolase
MIGPYDLSASMNLTAQFMHSDFLEAMDEILRKCNDAGITAGVHVVQPSKIELNQRLNEGYRFLAYSIDAVMLEKASGIFEQP